MEEAQHVIQAKEDAIRATEGAIRVKEGATRGKENATRIMAAAAVEEQVCRRITTIRLV